MSKLVGNPMDRFPCDTAHSIQSMLGYKVSFVITKGGDLNDKQELKYENKQSGIKQNRKKFLKIRITCRVPENFLRRGLASVQGGSSFKPG